MKKNEFRAEPTPCSVRPLSLCQELCVGCNQCVSVCQVDIMIPSPEKGEHPVVMYPGGCHYRGSRVVACPVKGTIRLRHPSINQTKFV